MAQFENTGRSFGGGLFLLSCYAGFELPKSDEWGEMICQTTAGAHAFYSGGMVSEAEFNEGLCARVRDLRKQRGWTSVQMATALDIPPDRYRKYEYRSPLPHYLIERFALIVGRDVDFVLTGKAARRREQG